MSPGINITVSAVSFQYNPSGDPVECHLQKTFISPFNSDYACFAFYMWADGRQNHWENRPDFPVMANAAKNGMPSLFLVSAPIGLDTTGGIPLSIWLHGGGGTARQSLAGSRTDIRLNPAKGILLAHNDDLFGKLLTYYSGFEGVSRHFGWRKNYDPFTGDAPVATDTIVNYTQRRYIWIDEWLIRNFNVDRNRININGHSMGSKGSTMLAKAFPDHYASATILNNGFQEDDPPALIDVIFGPSVLNFPTNLKGYDGQVIGYSRVMNLEYRLSSQRDLPLLRVFEGKNDTQSGASWDAYVVEQFHTADSLGWGAQLYWSERSHGPDTGPDYNDHWINGNAVTQQTMVDDIAYEEDHFRSDVSFPAFFNHWLDPANNDPGDGTPGTGISGVGDDWGTWGGYHRWDSDNIADLPAGWSVVAWLESGAPFAHDNCPVNALTADVAIRKPKQFKPVSGKLLNWSVKDVATGGTLQSGQTTVQADDLVIIPQVDVFRENIRRVRISVIDPSVAALEPQESGVSSLKIEPNPSREQAYLHLFAAKETMAELKVCGLQGRVVSMQTRLETGENHLALSGFANLPPGIYFVEVASDGLHATTKWVKM
ncbi:MAG: T9SS type A sorting domain-containing protein [Lewinellaceae bacterium]|nr:T9SS type A sorting domain-containing protein [Lewinellaceae bacterium]